jgi:cytoskeleton protein RodZ
MLRQARESTGLHIAGLAVLLKVPVKKLEALESDRFDLLPDAVFVRALASSVCRTLKIDSANILAQLPQTDAPKLNYRGTGINAPFRSPGDGSGPSVFAQVSKPVVWAGLLLLMGALVLILLPAIKSGISQVGLGALEFKAKTGETDKPSLAIKESEAGAADSQNISDSAVSSLVTTADSGISPEPTAAPVAAGIDGAPIAAKSSATLTVLGPLSASSEKVSSAAEAASSTSVVTSSTAPENSIVAFKAKAESWVEATDAKGQVVLRRTLAAGETAGASGELPLKVIVGRADGTEVQIRGKVFDVNAVAKDNVAKFEVK